jgi:hypothetical protein
MPRSTKALEDQDSPYLNVLLMASLHRGPMARAGASVIPFPEHAHQRPSGYPPLDLCRWRARYAAGS